MGKFLLKDVYIEVDGVDLSNFGFNIDTPSTKERIDVSGFNPNDTREELLGTRLDEITCQFTQSFTAGGPHDTLRSLYYEDASFDIKIRPTSAAIGADNPELSGLAKMDAYNGLSGALNARSEMTVTFVAADANGFTWADT